MKSAVLRVMTPNQRSVQHPGKTYVVAADLRLAGGHIDPALSCQPLTPPTE